MFISGRKGLNTLWPIQWNPYPYSGMLAAHDTDLAMLHILTSTATDSDYRTAYFAEIKIYPCVYISLKLQGKIIWTDIPQTVSNGFL